MIVTVTLEGAWTNVQGDEKQLQRSRFQGWFKREDTGSPRT
jgi:hypothetical protein